MEANIHKAGDGLGRCACGAAACCVLCDGSSCVVQARVAGVADRRNARSLEALRYYLTGNRRRCSLLAALPCSLGRCGGGWRRRKQSVWV